MYCFGAESVFQICEIKDCFASSGGVLEYNGDAAMHLTAVLISLPCRLGSNTSYLALKRLQTRTLQLFQLSRHLPSP